MGSVERLALLLEITFRELDKITYLIQGKAVASWLQEVFSPVFLVEILKACFRIRQLAWWDFAVSDEQLEKAI